MPARPARPGTSHVYIIRATINSISHPCAGLSVAPPRRLGYGAALRSPRPPQTGTSIRLDKPRVQRHDLIYQFPGNALWEEGPQCLRVPNSACELGGACKGALRTRGAGRGLRPPESSWVRAPSGNTGERLSSPRGSGGNPSLMAEGLVSGGAGAHRPRVGGCVRSQLCRRSGRTRLCSRSAHSCTAAHAGSVLGTHRCLQVGATGASFARAPEHAAPLACGPVPPPGCQPWPRPLHQLLVLAWGPVPPPRSGSPTQRAREASSWKPPGHSHTAPPGLGTQRPLTQRHSSESSSELSSSVPVGKMQTSTFTSASRWLGTPHPHTLSVPSRYTHLEGAFLAAGGSRPRRNCSHSVTLGTGTLGGAGAVSHAKAAPWLLPQHSANPSGEAHQRCVAGKGGTGLPNRGPDDSSSRRR